MIQIPSSQDHVLYLSEKIASGSVVGPFGGSSIEYFRYFVLCPVICRPLKVENRIRFEDEELAITMPLIQLAVVKKQVRHGTFRLTCDIKDSLRTRVSLR